MGRYLGDRQRGPGQLDDRALLRCHSGTVASAKVGGLNQGVQRQIVRRRGAPARERELTNEAGRTVQGSTQLDGNEAWSSAIKSGVKTPPMRLTSIDIS